MTPEISVMVPHHLNENQYFLDWCLKSIMASTDRTFEVWCMADTVEKPVVPEGVNLVWDKTLDNSTKKQRAAMKYISPHSKFIWYISDDVIVSKYAMDGLASAASRYHHHAIANPLSNSDLGPVFEMEIFVDNVRLSPKTDVDELAGKEHMLIEFPRLMPCRWVRPWVPFFCTMMTKETLEKVGDIDDKLVTRHDDQDYCFRAGRLGIPSVIEAGVFAFHWGSRTLNKTTNPAEKEAASRHFMEKWSGVMQENMWSQF